MGTQGRDIPAWGKDAEKLMKTGNTSAGSGRRSRSLSGRLNRKQDVLGQRSRQSKEAEV